MSETERPDATSGLLLSRRNFFIGSAMLATSAVAFARQPSAHNPVVKRELFEQWVPKKFGQWSVVGNSGVVLPSPDALSDRLYDNLVTRVYSSPRDAVMVLLAYNNRQDGVLQVHRPEICYPVGGYVLTPTQPISVPALGRQIPSNLFTATAADRTEQVVYFTRLGDAYPRSWAEQRLAVVEENLAGRIPDGIMLRASVMGSDRDAALQVLRNFIGGFVAASTPSLQRLLVA
jgi:EpsI family protein